MQRAKLPSFRFSDCRLRRSAKLEKLQASAFRRSAKLEASDFRLHAQREAREASELQAKREAREASGLQTSASNA